jgi:hypothetical protein
MTRMPQRKPTNMKRNVVCSQLPALVFCAAWLQADAAPPATAAPLVVPHQQWTTTNYAQSLAGDIMSLHPELNYVGIYAKQPGTSTYLLAGTSARFKAGKKADSDDMAIINGRVLNAKRPRGVLDIGLPLSDASGHSLGCLTLELKFAYTEDPAVGLKRATEIRDEVSKLIESDEQLFVPAGPAHPNDTYAQRLVEQISALHPETGIIGLHVVPPGQTGSLMIANGVRYKIGKKSDPDDLDVQKPGAKPVIEPKPDRLTTDTGQPLLDSAGHVIGTIVIEVKYNYEPDTDKAFKHSQEIRAEFQNKIPSVAKLFTQDSL